MRRLLYILIGLFTLASCHYERSPLLDKEDLDQQTRDSLVMLYERHYAPGTNLELESDSLNLACLPLQNCTNMIYKGERVVVAEIRKDTADVVDSIWVKLAHSDGVQGWVHEQDFKSQFVPVDSISQAIYVFSGTNKAAFVFMLTIFIAFFLIRNYQREPFKLVWFNDIESLYPLFLCLVVSCSASLYESMQLFVPDTWETYYYNPTFSPFKVPLLLGLFLGSLWLIIIASIAAVNETFRHLSGWSVLYYLVGLIAACLFCYLFFMLTTHLYIGYFFLFLFFLAFLRRLWLRSLRYPYRCGQCGQKLRQKGICPHCGALNQ
ncbi:MAG: hypothetical protein IJ256_07060 [Bacteroidaceae bacterium]|nr:hypothetical protein [Bacteroidaceae bacterium]